MLEIAEMEIVCLLLLMAPQETFLEKKDERDYSKLSCIMCLGKCGLDIGYKTNI